MLLLVGVATATASIGYRYDATTSDNIGAVGPYAVGADPSTGHIYVSDYQVEGIRRLTAAGAPAPFSALGTHIMTSSGPGNGPSSGGFSFLGKIITDSAGNFYVPDRGNHVINKFDSTGVFIEAFSPDLGANAGKVPNTEVGSFTPMALAFGPNDGLLYVADQYNGVIDVFEPSGGAYVRQYKVSPNPFTYATGVAVDGQDRIYANAGQLYRYSSGGTCLDGCVSFDPAGGYSVAVDVGREEVFSLTDQVSRFSVSGALIERFGQNLFNGAEGLAVNEATGTVYVADTQNGRLRVFSRLVLPDVLSDPASNLVPRGATITGSVAPASGGDVVECRVEYGTSTSYSDGSVPCSPAASPGTPYTAPTDVSASLIGLQPETTYHYRLIASNAKGAQYSNDATFTTPPAVASLATGDAVDVHDTSATLTGSLDPGGLSTQYYFEYGADTSYGAKAPIPSGDAGDGTGIVQLSVPISGLTPGQLYHYRLVGTNANGTTRGADRTFEADRSPTIESFTATDLGATTATLQAEINPRGADTTYHFEYGTTTSYGSEAPLPIGQIPSGNSKQPVSVDLKDLQPRVTYHFRVIATNDYGTTVTDDRTFSFFAPNCPNSHVRQETWSNTLPDCRAYELVTPAKAGATSFYAGGPTSPYATNPPRLAFTGVLGRIPGTPPPINALGDLYVSTRTSEGWVTKYVGFPSGQVNQMGGPPVPGYCSFLGSVQRFQNGVLTDLNMDQVVNWNSGNSLSSTCSSFIPSINDGGLGVVPSNSPYVWTADGELTDRWPTNLKAVPGAETIVRNEGIDGYRDYRGYRGAVAASADLSHYFFSSRNLAFAPNGLTSPPGSAYDNDVAHRTVTIISKTPSGEDIAQEPEQPGWEDPDQRCEQGADSLIIWYRNCESIRFAGVSADGSVDIGSSSVDGSRVLMSTTATQMCIPLGVSGFCPPEYSAPVHLYMRVNQAITYDVSRGKLVSYLGMTPDARQVFFYSPEQLTEDDDDTSLDIFRWDEATDDLTRLSTGDGAAGNSDTCGSTWIVGCGAGSASTVSLHRNEIYEVVGNSESDNFIADNGDIYFYSPELLDGTKGVEGKRNLYYQSDGEVHFVATLEENKPLTRIQVAPDNRHAAFVTRSRLTGSDNKDFLVMYAYDVEADKIICVSCHTSVTPPTSDVRGSSNGLFMSDDGRTFFSTADALVPQDTNAIRDIYEYVDGRPQLLSTGTGSIDTTGIVSGGFLGGFASIPSFIGVSADGVNAYFSSFESLVPQDENGLQLKIYNARTNGGFKFSTPPPPCAAADECHGVGSATPANPRIGTSAPLGDTGEVSTTERKGKKRQRKAGKKAKRKRERRRQRRAGGGDR